MRRAGSRSGADAGQRERNPVGPGQAIRQHEEADQGVPTNKRHTGLRSAAPSRTLSKDARPTPVSHDKQRASPDPNSLSSTLPHRRLLDSTRHRSLNHEISAALCRVSGRSRQSGRLPLTHCRTCNSLADWEMVIRLFRPGHVPAPGSAAGEYSVCDCRKFSLHHCRTIAVASFFGSTAPVPRLASAVHRDELAPTNRSTEESQILHDGRAVHRRSRRVRRGVHTRRNKVAIREQGSFGVVAGLAQRAARSCHAA